ncbi:hypothetical protein [Desulforudis sp. DRI-14]|uniref:hypothetical protein n=1 Tax=Desulforudis sp. DRI-14 TaxID=3459793 RepID=UPI004042360D
MKIAQKQFLNIFPGMLGIIGLIGLMLALVPREIIQSLFGNDSLVGILLISAVGSITLMPAFIAFPLASSLSGSSRRPQDGGYRFFPWQVRCTD